MGFRNKYSQDFFRMFRESTKLTTATFQMVNFRKLSESTKYRLVGRREIRIRIRKKPADDISEGYVCLSFVLLPPPR